MFYNNYATIISRGTNGNAYQPIIIKLIDCYYDCDNSRVLMRMDPKYLVIDYCHLENPKTNDIIQLNLGDCKGEATPGPLVELSPSHGFTETTYFSYSDDFCQSKDFSKSSKFAPTDMFSESNDFSKSRNFAPSGEFTKSYDFTKSDNYAPSEEFTKSDDFSKSIDFIPTDNFTKSDNFPSSEKLTKSNCFTESRTFTPSDRFTKSNEISESNIFSDSVSFLIPVPVVPEGDERSANKTNSGMIADVTVAAVAVVASLIAGVVFWMKKKKNHISQEDVETIDPEVNSIQNVIPIYVNGGMEDPFKEDFDLTNFNKNK